mmetsp:Transcript_4991/g.16052  ORF Transcript_4991/g.16052 Transcript_4991/m.16052 type:complete len:251 (-) Transcript_4991:352-1104(-)
MPTCAGRHSTRRTCTARGSRTQMWREPPSLAASARRAPTSATRSGGRRNTLPGQRTGRVHNGLDSARLGHLRCRWKQSLAAPTLAWQHPRCMRTPDVQPLEYSDCDMRGVAWQDLPLEGGAFDSSDVSRSNFKLSKLHGASFNDADGTESSFVQAVLIGASLNRGVWVKADFSRAALSPTRRGLREQRLFTAAAVTRSAELVDAKLELSNFQLASFAGTNLVGSSLVNSSFRDAETRRAAPARRQAAPRC